MRDTKKAGIATAVLGVLIAVLGVLILLASDTEAGRHPAGVVFIVLGAASVLVGSIVLAIGRHADKTGQ